MSKGSSVRLILEAVGKTTIPTYAFGDGLNDLPLFAACDYSIAMGNARTVVKEKATYVTTANTADGITRGLKQFNLI